MNQGISTFRFRDRELQLGKRTYIMGIINVTPDSFSDGGKHFCAEDALIAAIEMENQGADILDIGGQSTRPGYIKISAEEEWSRLEQALHLILNNTALPISVDTFYPEVAEKALALGCHIINDVSGTASPKMAEVIKKYNAGWVLMHSGGEQSDDICAEVHNGLCALLAHAVSLGIEKSHICLDPGIGFGKTAEQNYRLISGTSKVKIRQNAYLLGASRKRFIGAVLPQDISVKERDFGTVAAHTVGIMGGADIIRVHNVKGSAEAAKIADELFKKRVEV